MCVYVPASKINKKLKKKKKQDQARLGHMQNPGLGIGQIGELLLG